jgi:hypothetical protein
MELASLISVLACSTLSTASNIQQRQSSGYDSQSGTESIVGSSSNVDSDAGASGSSSGNSFTISKGGLAAIIVVVVAVVILGGEASVPSFPMMIH